MDLKNILESADKIKVSIVMQVNLANYSRSRSSAVDKFHRAVESFKNQLYKNAELIIVADGCDKTYEQYMQFYRKDSNIRFAYFDRRGDNLMYSKVSIDSGDYTYFRGMARNIGYSIATGEVVTYMDSDDCLMPNHTLVTMLHYNASPDKDWWLNNTWYDHSIIVHKDQEPGLMVDPRQLPDVEIDFLKKEGPFKAVRVNDNRLRMAPWLLTHRNGINVDWRDTLGRAEDVDFYNRMILKYKNGEVVSTPIYVRCHLHQYWDV